jgi:iron complex transport system substrate-binding protein
VHLSRLELQPRIVSLIASATECVYELGLGEFLVGRSHECDYPPEVALLPCCTQPRIDVNGSSQEIDARVKDSLSSALSVYTIFDDVLERLQPTHIVTQVQCEVCAVSLTDVERSIAGKVASQPKVVPLNPNSLADIWDDLRRIGTSIGIDPEPTITRLQHRMREGTITRVERRTIACIEWLEPLMAAGNWVPELVELAGGINLFGTAGQHSPWMTWEDVLAANPDVLLAMPCGFTIERTLPEMHWLTDRPGYSELKAVRNGDVFVADGNRYFNRPGPSVVESLQVLAEILNPDRVAPVLDGIAYCRL